MLAILGDLPFDLGLDVLDVVGANAARSFESKPAAVLESFDHANVLSDANATSGTDLHAPQGRKENRRIIAWMGIQHVERGAQGYWPSSFVTRLAIFTPLSPLTYFAMPR